jgi:glucosamine-6-phosphate deaminase
VNIRTFDTAEDAAIAAARHIAEAVSSQPRLVLGLPAGQTPVPVYAELRRLHQTGEANFSLVTTFNLDEFAGIDSRDPRSFRMFMEEHLLAELRLAPSHVHFLNGNSPSLEEECARYEREIDSAGGIGLQILGIGANGHIGFNEPGDHLAARTHCMQLAASTRRANAARFGGDETRVPREALSMGVGTILKAEAILLVATGEKKAQSIRDAITGPVTTHLPASFLQLHRRVSVYLDRAAARLLTR